MLFFLPVISFSNHFVIKIKHILKDENMHLLKGEICEFLNLKHSRNMDAKGLCHSLFITFSNLHTKQHQSFL